MNTASSSLSIETASPQGRRLPSWKDEVNARLSEHRNRRGRTEAEQAEMPGMESAGTASQMQSGNMPGRPQSVAARVAERFSKAPSYHEMLAAARAAELAAAEAAEQARATTQTILASMDDRGMAEEPEPSPMARGEATGVPDNAGPVSASWSAGAPAESRPAESWSANYHQPLPQPRRHEEVKENRISHSHSAALLTTDPFAEAVITPAQPLPAKLLEFPRELVASRKARPRRDEGPLLDEHPAPELRIFEAESEEGGPGSPLWQSSPVASVAPAWHSIRLDGHVEMQASFESKVPATPLDLPLRTAPLADRMMAGIVDLALVLFAFLLFVLIFTACNTHPPMGKQALFGAGIALGGLFALYQGLFFTYSDATPGMRYARIALCTFDDENPSRRSLRHRVAALLLAALPLGLGFAWSFFDEDRLGWHDRMTRTYQRSYR